MSEVNLNIFDCNTSLGRRHDERVSYGSREELLSVMAEAGIARALVYNPYSIKFGTMEGNRFLVQEIGGEPTLVPQFVVSSATDTIDDVQNHTRKSNVRTICVFPVTQRAVSVICNSSWFSGSI